MQVLLQSFQQHLQQLGYSLTIQRMLPALVKEFTQQQQLTDISCVEQQRVKAFYEYLQTRPLKLRTGALSEMMIRHYVYALRTFFTWAEVTGQADYNPISGLKFPKAQANTREPLNLQEVDLLFEVADTLRQRALLHLFYSCGLRRSEGEMLNIADIHFRQRLLYVRRGKGAKRRVVPLTDKVARELEAYYLQDRCGHTARKVTDEAAFILNRTGGRITGDQLSKLLRDMTAKANLGKEVTPHHLRHSIATHLLQGGMPMRQVRDFLGHLHLETTQVYAKPTTQQLKW